MANIVWFPFYIGDYLKDTQELSAVEHGMYIKLMLWYYNKGAPIPHDRRYAIAGANADAFAGDLLTGCSGVAGDMHKLCDRLLSEFFEKDGNVWRHYRIDGEIEKQQNISKSRSLAAKKRHEKHQKDSDANAPASAVQKHTQSQSQSHSLHKCKLKGEPLPDWVDKKTWQDFIEMRIKMKKPMTENAKKLLLNKLKGFYDDGENATQVLEQSIMNGWASIYTTKGRENNGPTNRRPNQTETIIDQIANIT